MTAVALIAALAWMLPPVHPSEIYWPEKIVRIC